MKVRLEKHVSAIFSTLNLSTHFEVFECEKDVMPEWTSHVLLTHEFLVCCEQPSGKDKLQRFLQKEVYRHKNTMYWFEGERIIYEELPQENASQELLDNSTGIEYLKTETRLPQWLDNFIFTHLKAEYAPDFQRFEYNLDLNKDENKKYLGTYFPRSYAESFCIFDNIFQNRQYHEALSQKESLSILSIGCGTGGDLTGLITVIEKYYPKKTEINIWALDGNKEALFVLEQIVDKFSVLHSRNIKLKTIELVFNSIAQFDTQQLNGQTFDFILSFKMICEIISSGKGKYDNSYYDFVMKFAPLLSNCGLCVLLDVTTMTEHNNTFNPILKNGQINQALRELKNYRTLLPLSCNKNENTCTIQCFTQQKFHVSHKRKTNDRSKVSYRVITNSNFANSLVNTDEAAQYVLQRNGKNIERLCPKSYGKQTIDGYKLKS